MVVVLVSGNAVAMPWLDEVPSVVQTWYLGTITGNALADVLSGDANPSGKLPFSYPAKLEDCPAHAFDALCYPGDRRCIKKISSWAIVGMIRRKSSRCSPSVMV